ncbi:uncharacterized protein isoform X1 [Bombus fervidus]|uniref:uncharacterized protein isoform X1 n=1 Tax=Bombus fervidus TaxID=203811 RepID=UPI002138A973
MDEVHDLEDWRISLSSRNNVIYNGTPYVPMLVENILIHISFEDYETNGIKTIQTVGKLIPKTETFATLLSVTPGNNSAFSVSLKILKVGNIYIKDSNDIYCPIWKKCSIFKIYGTLKKEGLENVLEASHLVPVQDVVGTWNVMASLSIIARSEYRHYYRTKGQSNMLQLQWDRMKKENKRVIKKDINI